MKKLFITMIVVALGAVSGFAQKFALVDMDYKRTDL